MRISHTAPALSLLQIRMPGFRNSGSRVSRSVPALSLLQIRIPGFHNSGSQISVSQPVRSSGHQDFATMARGFYT
eukprot:5409663-Alexandrium_andersonii.AAC.1